MRIKSRWNVKGKTHSVEETAGALAGICWRIAANGVLELENEGFQTDTQAQRLDVMTEYLAYLIHIVDRMSYETLEEAERHAFITALALAAARIMQDNLRDLGAIEPPPADFIETLNARMSDYAAMSFTEAGEPGFSLRCALGDNIAARMGPKDNRWIQDQVLEIEAPRLLKPLNKALDDLLFAPQ